MNRTILIVICDFLLVSLLAFSTVDINKVADEGVERQVKVDIVTNQVDTKQDLAVVMRLALDDERRGRDLLLGELAKARDTLAQTRETVGRQQATLGEREKQIQDFQHQIQSNAQQSARLQQEKSALQDQYASARTNLQSLQHQLQQSAIDNQVSRERLAAMEAELRKQQEQAGALERGLEQLAQSNLVMQAERQQLASQLQVAEAEKRAATEQAGKLQDEVKIVREEKARLTQHADKLADGVKVLAANSGELAKEIREHRPLAPNTIFSEFLTNRVHARFHASRAGIFGLEANSRKETEMILVSDGTNVCALAHVDDTPLVFATPGTDWASLTGTLNHGIGLLSIKSLSFYLLDPRLVLLPLDKEEVRQLGARVYSIASDPFKFQDAVIVGAREGYYGECKFQIDLSTPQYFKMDRNFLKGIFGKFNPSRGDLVFSRTGELLGVMANGTYCVKLHNFNAAASLQLGPDIRSQNTAETLSRMHSLILRQPFRLQ